MTHQSSALQQRRHHVCRQRLAQARLPQGCCRQAAGQPFQQPPVKVGQAGGVAVEVRQGCNQVLCTAELQDAAAAGLHQAACLLIPPAVLHVVDKLDNIYLAACHCAS